MAGRGPPAWLAATALLVVGAVVWDAVRRVTAGGEAPAPAAVAESGTTRAAPPRTGVRAGSTPAAAAPRESSYVEQLARAEARRRIRSSAGITYLDDFLAASQDSMLHRWDNRVMDPVRVYLAGGTAANYRPEFLDAIRAAFARWAAALPAVRFDLVADSTTAEVRVRWRAQFDIDRTGQTDLVWDERGHLESGIITFATFDPHGRAMDPDDIRTVALHEVGHLIGLDHSSDSLDIMFPVAKVRELSERDVQSARLLYELAPGSIR
jgi:predicted Zn-dependent protease